MIYSFCRSTAAVVIWVLIGATVLSMLLAVTFFSAAIWGWRGPHRMRRLIALVICLAAVPALAGLQRLYFFRIYYAARQSERAARRAERAETGSLVHIGDLAPSFRLTDTTGREFSLDAHRGKAVLMNFFATWCEPCLMELPHLERLYRRHEANPRFAMIVIGRKESNDVVNAFRLESEYPFPMAADQDGSVVAQYATESIPRSYLVSSEGRIVFASVGFDLDDLAKLAAELMRQLGQKQ
jgi:thiol-disulfide isomerase/thioredoxin